MSRSWEGVDSLVGMVGNINLNGKTGNGIPTSHAGFYPQMPAAVAYTVAPTGALALDPLVDNTAYLTGVGPFVGQPNGYATNAYHPATMAAGMPSMPYQPRAPIAVQPDIAAAVAAAGGAQFMGAAPVGMEGYAVPANLGWGGQAIQDAGGFKAPWFGKSRGRNGNGNGNGNGHNGNNGRNGRNRGRNGNNGYQNGGANGHRNGMNGNRGRRNWGDGMEDDAPEDQAVETLVKHISRFPADQSLSDDVYQALFPLQGRSCALLLKELARSNLHRRAAELFDWLRALEQGHPLQSLLDVYSYTAAISLCIGTHDSDRALQLAGEMKAHSISRNVHTYTALMNVCIKCSKYELALQTYETMRADRCTPNVVTYNTLIDVHGKMGRWEDAVAVLSTMKAEGIEPVLRTYNTLLIACNMCSQPREAMAVYRRMLEEGFAPNSTTYNALISAYGKAGQLDRVMEVFQEMIYRGCECNVITYSSLISACEKAGRWELALELFQEMIRERCTPNTVTFNSLITALGQGAQWQKAEEVFQEMQVQGCVPDVVTYTALISALEKGGQWRRALSVFESMQRQGCRADSIVYNAIIDSLWETGVVWAQRQALGLFRSAVREGHFSQSRLTPGMARAEVNLHAMTAGVAMLSLYAWLVSLKTLVTTGGSSSMPIKLAVVTDRGRGAKEQGNLVVKEAVSALMTRWGAPFKPLGDLGPTGTLEATGGDVASWLLSDDFEAQIFAFFPCTDILPSMANAGQSPAALASVAVALDDVNAQKEIAVEQRCTEAFAAVRLFEKTHCLALQNMGFAYLQRRSELVNRCSDIARSLYVKLEAGHDAVLLMDRVMSTSLNLAPDLLDLLAVACVIIAAKQVDGPSSTLALPESTDIEAATGLPAAAIEQMEWNVRQVLGQDTAAISTLRCLKLYLERLGGHAMDKESAELMAGRSFALIDECLADMAFLNCRPSVIAAAVLYTDRRARGIIPFWPTMLAKVTGYQDMSTPELSVAIKAAQRMVTKINSGGSSVKTSGSGSPGGSQTSSSPRSSCSVSKAAFVAGITATLPRSASNSSISVGLGTAPSSASLTSTQAGSMSVVSASSGANSTSGAGLEGREASLTANQAVLMALEKGTASLSHLSGVLTPTGQPLLTPVTADSSSNGDASENTSNSGGDGSIVAGSGGTPEVEILTAGATSTIVAVSHNGDLSGVLSDASAAVFIGGLASEQQ